jgi:tetratricopeptide (TPR) repeat protein
LVLEKLPLLIAAVAWSLVTFCTQSVTIAGNAHIGFLSRIGNALTSYVAYIGHFFFPVGLAIFYPHPIVSLPLWKIAAALFALTAISTVVLIFGRRRPYLPIGWFWYLGMLVPVIGIVQVGSQAMADRYTYLPQIGLCIALTWLAADTLRSWTHCHAVCGIAAAVILAFLMGCAWRQTGFWRDSETLWRHSLDCTDDNIIAQTQLGLALAGKGRFAEAIPHYRDALQFAPKDAVVHNSLGDALMACGKSDEAMTSYRIVLAAKPEHVTARNNLGILLACRGRYPEAIACFEKSLAFDPEHAATHHNLLGNVMTSAGRFGEAITHFRQSLAAQPNNLEALRQLSLLLSTCPTASLRNGKESVELAQRANKLCKGEQPEVLDILATACAEVGKFSDAVATERKALDLAKQRNAPAEWVDAMRAKIALYETGKSDRSTSVGAAQKTP